MIEPTPAIGSCRHCAPNKDLWDSSSLALGVCARCQSSGMVSLDLPLSNSEK